MPIPMSLTELNGESSDYPFCLFKTRDSGRCLLGWWEKLCCACVWLFWFPTNALHIFHFLERFVKQRYMMWLTVSVAGGQVKPSSGGKLESLRVLVSAHVSPQASASGGSPRPSTESSLMPTLLLCLSGISSGWASLGPSCLQEASAEPRMPPVLPVV